MAGAAIGATRGIAHTGTVRRLAIPGGAAGIVDAARVALAVVLVALAMAGIAATCDFLAGAIPPAGPQPGY